MKYRASDRRSQKSQATQPREPDTIPIMNLFLTIIPMLLLMVVVSQTALISMNFNSNSGGGGGSDGVGGGDKKNDAIQIIIMAHDQPDAEIFKGFRIKEPGKGNKDIHFVNSEYDFVGLNKALAELKSQNPSLGAIEIVPYENVDYGVFLRAIDLCKNNQINDVGFSVRKTAIGIVGG